MDWTTHKKQLLQNPEFQKALTDTKLEYQIARALVEARVKRGITQEQLAKRLKTKQSVISRAENAKQLPSLSFLKRLADILDMELRVSFH